MYTLTCAIDVVSPSNLLYNLDSNVLHVLSDLDPPGLDHEHIFVHCKQRGGGRVFNCVMFLQVS